MYMYNNIINLNFILDTRLATEDVNVAAFKEAIRNGGSLSLQACQCISIGMPRSGKTSLGHRLLDKKPPGQPTTQDKQGRGSNSTGVLTDQKIIQVKIDTRDSSTTKAIFGDESKWIESASLNEEVAFFATLFHKQQKSKRQKSITTRKSSSKVNSQLSTISDPPTITKQTPSAAATPLSTTPLSTTDSANTGKSKSQSSSTSMDMTVLDGLTAYLKDGSVSLKQMQALLDVGMTIYYSDCGGQDEFVEVLPAFMAGPTVFILVFNLSHPLNCHYDVRYESSKYGLRQYPSSGTVKEVLMRFCSSILSFRNVQLQQISAVNEADETSVIDAPPASIISVGTHRDLVNDDDIEKADSSLQDCIKNTELEGIMEFNTEDQLIIPIDNFCEEDGRKIRQVFDRAMKRKVKGKNRYKTEIPAQWLGLDLCLKTATIFCCFLSEMH